MSSGVSNRKWNDQRYQVKLGGNFGGNSNYIVSTNIVISIRYGAVSSDAASTNSVSGIVRRSTKSPHSIWFVGFFASGEGQRTRG